MTTSSIDTTAALQYFKTCDAVMHQLLTEALQSDHPLTLPTPKPPAEYFGSLLTSIISQQISVAAARAIKTRVAQQLGSLTPAAVQAIDFEQLKSCGLSTQKTIYLKRNAEIWHEIPFADFEHLPDEAIITELTKLYGIGRWTAEMFLMFSLARPDVFSFGDLGLMQSLQQHYNYKPHYVRKIRTTVQNWSPHRTVAALVLWHRKDTPTES